MNLTSTQEFAYFSLCLEGFSFGKISVLRCPVHLNTIPGFYSAIFVLYLRYQLASKEGSEKTAMGNILFYSLCALYILTASIIMLDMSYFILRVVSNDSTHDHL